METQDRMENLEILLKDLYSDLQETITQIIERTIQHREYYHMNLKDELEESFNKISDIKTDELEYEKIRREHQDEKD